LALKANLSTSWNPLTSHFAIATVNVDFLIAVHKRLFFHLVEMFALFVGVQAATANKDFIWL
jgi:hypothetical protein